MEQTCMDLRPPDLPTARAVGQVAQQLATANAERDTVDFRARAEAAILAKLTTGPASGEDVTDYVQQQVGFKDGRRLGSLYCSMRKRGQIRIVGACDRRKGHGTGGGKVYALGVDA